MTKRDISLNFCFISIRCYSCTLFVHVWWVQGPGVPVMYLFNEWCNQFLMNLIRSLWENQDLYRIMVVSICREQLTVSMITQLPRTLHRAVTRYGLTHVISISLPSHSIPFTENTVPLLLSNRQLLGITVFTDSTKYYS